MEPRTGSSTRKLYSQSSNPLLTALASSASSRPLSDIKEITETSLFDGTAKNRPENANSFPRAPSGKGENKPSRANDELSRQGSVRGRRSSVDYPHHRPERSSIYSIPVGNVPPRSSSKTRHSRSISIPREPAVLLPPPRAPFHCISNNGQAQSPVKDVIGRVNPHRNPSTTRIPSKTIVKLDNPSSDNILGHPVLQHPRLKVDLLVAAPLFVGGSSVEGTVRIVVDEAERVRHRKTLTLERVSIDLLGLEEVSSGTLKRHVFLALGNELVDLSHPPPVDMVESQKPIPPLEKSWILIPSLTNLPFLIKLPLNVGPPPFRSKHARIRYVLCATLTIKDAGRQLCVRCSQDTVLLSVSDPEKALISLPSPLTVSETFTASSYTDESITLTAGLHRQVWVSGTNLFTDVHIVNNSRKTVKKLELRLECIVLCYEHAAAATLETSASNARMFDHKEQSTVAKTTVKSGIQGWSGVLPHTTILRTCEMELPRGHATVHCHKFFEVRYYLYIIAYATRTKVATVQLPIHIIHMNSLDVPTNTVAQVAAAIEEKRRGRSKNRNGPRQLNTKPSEQSFQGRAFSAPRKHSLDRARAQREDLHNLTREFQNSPRKKSTERTPKIGRVGSSFSFKTPPSNRKGRIINDHDAEALRNRLNRVRQTSFESMLTNRSVPRSKYPHRNSSALGFYLQGVDGRYPNLDNESIYSSMRVSQDRQKPRRGHERGKPVWVGPNSQYSGGQDL